MVCKLPSKFRSEDEMLVQKMGAGRSKQQIVEKNLHPHSVWSNYSDLTRPKTPNGGLVREMGPLISGKSRLVKYYNLPTYILPCGGLYATYHLLGEPETTIEKTFISIQSRPAFSCQGLSLYRRDGPRLHAVGL